ncbi:hypothetical protein PV341_16005 [Streptomyces sp. PA03-1a]|nr:hypothetical protein [Streptomyces sp. PA03-1a]MDX2815218.1 hypothetical protein [Streptomyces sp. PA03-5A]
MADHHVAALAYLSWNPSAPADVLLRLLRHDDRVIRRNVAQRRGLPLEVVDAILTDPDPALRACFAESENADPAQRARLLDDPSPRVILGLAIGPTPYRTRVDPLPDWAYERLLAHPDGRIRCETVISRLVPGHLLARLADHADGPLRQAACRAWDSLTDDAKEALLHDDDLDVRRAAAMRVCHQDAERTAWLVESLTNPWDLARVLRGGLLSRELAERLVTGDRPGAVAANPSLPPDLVARLATHPDPHVRLVVSARPELTERERAAVDYTVGPEDRLDALDWVREAQDDPEVLRRCATSAHTWLRRSAAVCPGLEPEYVELLSRDEDFAVRLLLCEFHPEPPPETLLDLYLNGTHRAVEWFANHPRFPAAGLAERFADSADPEAGRLALTDPDLPVRTLEEFARDPDRRWAAARHPRLPVPLIRELLDDPGTTHHAAGNPGLPAEDMHRLLDGAGVPD